MEEAAGGSLACSSLGGCGKGTAGEAICTAVGAPHNARGPSGRLAGGDDGKVDVGLGDPVDVVRPGVERDVEHDLDHLRIVISGQLHGAYVLIAHMAALEIGR